MSERQIDVAGNTYVPLSQQQIADITEISKKTVNMIIKELKDNGYIEYKGKTRGKYFLTDKANKELHQISIKEDML
jgi:Transcriptional regulator